MSDGGDWVLVVDDDEDIRTVIGLVLEMHGYRTVGAGDGEEALQVIRACGRPCLILLDVMMPRLDGPAFAEAIHAEPAMCDLPLVVISGDVAADQTAAGLGAEGFLTKPFDLDDLVTMVKQHATQTCGQLREGRPAP